VSRWTLEVRGGVVLANQSGSVVSSQGSTTSSSSYSSSNFQISELLHFIEFRKKFIKVQNQFCLKP
jgi:hypothetical protein